MLPGPVAVGGIGGSGTRVVARILQTLGGYLGGVLNESLDNLWFTLLMKRPAMLSRRRSSEGNTAGPLATFDRAMTEGLRDYPRADEEWYIEDAFRERVGDVTLKQAASLFTSGPPPGYPYEFWGFKEPCAAMWVEEMAAYWANLRYVHVVRDGQDMCLSHTMRRVIRDWGPHFGVYNSESVDARMRFWKASNSAAISAGEQLGERFLLVPFEDLCENPRAYIEQLGELAGVRASRFVIDEAEWFVRAPSSIGRGANLEVSPWA
jgi:hypothetical protein